MKRHFRFRSNLVLNTASSWHLEHGRFEHLLEFLENQISVLGDRGLPNYRLMCDVMNFLCHFGARYHHPREEIAFGYIVRSNPTMSGSINRLILEHADITAKGEELAAMLDEVVARTQASVAKAIAAYLVLYRNHITFEEENILPYAAESLSTVEWGEVATAAPLGPDPFQMYGASRHNPNFGSEADVRYHALCEMIQTGRSFQSGAYPVHRAIASQKHLAGDPYQKGGILVDSPLPIFVSPINLEHNGFLVRQTVGLLALVLAFLLYNHLDVQLKIANLPSIEFLR